MRVEIKDANVIVGSMTTKSGGKMETRTQEAFFALSNGECFKLRVSVGRDRAPYAAGLYVLSDESFTKGPYDDLELKRNIVLAPVTSPKSP